MPKNLAGIESNFIDSWEEWDGAEPIMNFYQVKLNDATKKALGEISDSVTSISIDCGSCVVCFLSDGDEVSVRKFVAKLVDPE